MKVITQFWNNLPLASKISGLSSLLITITVLALTFLSIRREQANFSQELADQASLLLETIPLIMQDELYNVQLDEFIDLSNSLGDNPNVTRFIIHDSQGRILVDSSRPDQVFSFNVDALGEKLLGLPEEEVYMAWQEGQLLAGRAIILGQRPIGAIAIGLSTEPLDRKIAAITQQGISLALVALAFGGSLTVLLARQITNPISELTVVAAQMAGGDLAIRVKPRSRDEIGALGEAFNQMAQSIQDRETELRTLAAGLERSVAERTTELRRQNEILEKMATSDSLTKVYNRRHFFTLAELEAERARRYHHPLVILMIDADDFKKINDTYGHLCGDQMLIHLVQICQESIRKVDILARFGGEEFIILMPESSQEAARVIAERLRSTLASSPLDFHDQSIRLTISAGIAAWPGEGELNIETLINHADQALYQSKQAGRNLVTCWQA